MLDCGLFSLSSCLITMRGNGANLSIIAWWTCTFSKASTMCPSNEVWHSEFYYAAAISWSPTPRSSNIIFFLLLIKEHKVSFRVSPNASKFKSTLTIQCGPLYLFHVFSSVYWTNYRERIKGVQILLSNSQVGPVRTVKHEQEEISHNHVQALWPISVYGLNC